MEHATRPLTGQLRARINRLAHAHGLSQATRLRASLLAQVKSARDAGAGFDELAALVARMEADGGSTVQPLPSPDRPVLQLRTAAK